MGFTLEKQAATPNGSLMAKQISQWIDAQIDRERTRLKSQKTIPKLLVLGSGDSGKTTLLKQMNILYGNGFTASEMEEFRRQAIDNILDSIKKLCLICHKNKWVIYCSGYVQAFNPGTSHGCC